ncbi:SpoIID/LytB domain-containing protein [Cohnella sp. CFH 77786]|uniref:SpoIID/LytB domain-containing protein n=1 Tax=Cohnella sp. CFH 77786 TaxID=2662265 RepID=UPI001C6104E5|nr:SpoIID/LytB domain-containing protein [Cohnella sp. CFH 77786]MBW5447891.1 SpoIID/LytB domain-containing protein [Cohnella sp. CFH 77786]
MIIRNVSRTSYRYALFALIVIIVLSGSGRRTAYAAVNVPDTIRVGLFLNLPSKNFTSLTPAATLQSSAGMTIAWRDPQFTAAIDSITPGQPVRFAMDGYRAIVLETADAAGAFAVLKNLQASSQSAFVTRLTKSGKTVYQVSEGVYATPAAASAALAKWTSAVAAAGVPQAANPKVAGPWAAEAGPYAGRAEAAAAAEAFGNAGLDAFVAVKMLNGTLSYVVRVGQEADAAGASALQQAASAAGGVNVRVPPAGEPYALIRQDMTLTGPAGSPVTLYAIPASAGAVLRAEPAAGGTVQLAERYKRSYRGAMEMSVLNGALAVVNEIDFEQYLYSVVGAEVGPGWPAEAQKAQAVAARSYALSSGTGFQIANVVDTTLSQAYNGTASENPNSTAGVQATAGEVLTHDGRVINAVFSSNAGGLTADNRTEGWGSDTGYLPGGIASPDDGPQAGLPDWYDVALASGQRGYIRGDLLADAGRNAAGLRVMTVTGENTAVRVRPKVETNVEPIVRLSAGTTVIPIGKVPENTAYSWVETPFKPDVLLASLNKYIHAAGPLQTLEVTGRGPSGRVNQVSVNGTPYTLKAPDSWRSALGGLRSTLITIEETGRMTIVGAGEETRKLPQESGPLQIMGADGQTRSADGTNLFVMDASGQARVVTPTPAFIISAKGYGHGLGMSQYGAKKLAEQGNDYRYILQYYYKDVVIEKDANR